MNDGRITLITADQFLHELVATFYMAGVALAIGAVLGMILGTVVVVTRPSGILQNRPIYLVVNTVVNLVRSLPFIILLVAILPFTRALAGTAIGPTAAIVPLTIMIAPFIGRLVENSLLEVPASIIEAARSMGATPWQIFVRFLLPEARGSLILAITTASIGLIDATAMAGTVGAGGIGDLAISYGYRRFDGVAMLVTVITLIIIVQLVQWLGNTLSRRVRRR